MLKKIRHNALSDKGITLTSLVTSIIVLIILAGISINIMTSDNGIIETTKETIKNKEIREIEDILKETKLELMLMQNDVTLVKYLKLLKQKETIINEANIIQDEQYPDNIVDVVIKGQRFTLTDINEDEQNIGDIQIIYVGEENKLLPTVQLAILKLTTETLEVKAKSRYATNPKYEYYIKKSDEEDSKYIKDGDTTESTEHTFYNLTQNESYTVKVVLKTNNNNELKRERLVTTLELGDIQEGDITFNISEREWTNQDVTAKAIVNNEKLKNYKLQTSLNENDWQDTDTQVASSSSDVIYARITDGQGNCTSTAKYSNFKIDKLEPEITSALKNTNITTNAFTVNIGISDNLSGLSKIIWYYKLSSNTNYLSTTQTLSGEQTSITRTITNLVDGKYNIYAEIYDAVGNIKTSNSIDVIIPFTIVGSVSGGYSASISCTNINNYQNLTANKFFFECTQIDVPSAYGTLDFTKSYNSSTGTLTINRNSLTGDGLITFIGKIYKGSNLTLVGTTSGGYTVTLDCTSIKDWKNKTADDFIVEIKNVEIPYEASGTMNFSKTYDSATGKLTITRSKLVGEGIIQFSANVYAIAN